MTELPDNHKGRVRKASDPSKQTSVWKIPGQLTSLPLHAGLAESLVKRAISRPSYQNKLRRLTTVADLKKRKGILKKLLFRSTSFYSAAV